MNLTAGQQVGKYINVEHLGSGSFGSVYLMHDNLLNRNVAVKFVENQNPNAFVAHFEARILHQCRHDRIVAVNSVDVVQDNAGRHFAAIDMEYIAGGSTQAQVESDHVTIRRAIKISIDVLLGLEHAHRHNILHRDIKPANIMLVGSRAKVSDFGLATTASAALTASGAGSPVYCAPEVINDNITSIKTDVFAAGMSLFQLANNITNLGARISSLDTVRLGRVIPTIGYKAYIPRRLRLICNKACAVDHIDRFESAFAMRQALERLHVQEDWDQVSPNLWLMQRDRQHHEMTIAVGPPLEMIYRINGRRRNSNCRPVSSFSQAVDAQHAWIYRHTF